MFDNSIIMCLIYIPIFLEFPNSVNSLSQTVVKAIPKVTKIVLNIHV